MPVIRAEPGDRDSDHVASHPLRARRTARRTERRTRRLDRSLGSRPDVLAKRVYGKVIRSVDFHARAPLTVASNSESVSA
jgi:hypothetical protein